MGGCIHGFGLGDVPCPGCADERRGEARRVAREMNQERIVIIDYTNHRGERRERQIIPGSISFEETPDHNPAQWVCRAWDCEKKAQRTFALKNIHSWRPV